MKETERMKALICHAVITLTGVQLLLAGFLLYQLGMADTVGYAWGAAILGVIAAIIGVRGLWTAGGDHTR